MDGTAKGGLGAGFRKGRISALGCERLLGWLWKGRLVQGWFGGVGMHSCFSTGNLVLSWQHSR